MTPAGKPFHQMVWIDHHTAKLYGVTRNDLIELAVIHAPDEGAGHLHHKAGTAGSGHAEPSHTFLTEVAKALQDAQEILIVGPSDTKYQLKKHLARNAPKSAQRVVNVESMDKCSYRDLQAFASVFLRKADRTRERP